MPSYNSTSRTPFAKGGRVAFKAGASEKMKSEVAEAAKKKRDRLQAQHITPGGRLSESPGPHKRSSNRIATEALVPFLPKKAKEGIIKFADKFDKKQLEKGDLRREKKKMQKRAKKLTAYEGTT